jgi:hypothetical protein
MRYWPKPFERSQNLIDWLRQVNDVSRCGCLFERCATCDNAAGNRRLNRGWRTDAREFTQEARFAQSKRERAAD